MTSMQKMLNNPYDECELLNTNYVTKSLLGVSEKKVVVHIAPDDQKFLQDANYSLCFAKKVGDKYSVVWRSYSREDYGPTNTFSWVPNYEVFWTNSFKSNVVVNVQSEKRKMFLGETTTIDKYGSFSPPATGGDQNSLSIVNKRGRLHLGVSQQSSEGSTPIYVAPSPMEVGAAKLTPVEEVKVWFQQEIKTSTMISDITTTAVEIDLTDVPEYTLTYENGKWLHK